MSANAKSHMLNFFSTVTLTFLLFSLLMPCRVSAHAIITPAIGVNGTPSRADAKRPSSNAPCGSGVDVAKAIPGSSAVDVKNGEFTVTVMNFNAGQDGSTEITKTEVDPTGTGKSFNGGSVTITKNGVQDPATTGSVQVSGTLPAGSKCTGGNDGASCLVSFTTLGGFGNCVLVSQGPGSGNGASTSAGGAHRNLAMMILAGREHQDHKDHHDHKHHKNKTAAGSRLARSLKMRAELDETLERRLESGNGTSGSTGDHKKQKDHKEHHDHKHHKNETSAEVRPARSLKMRAEPGEIFERHPESGNGTSGSTGDHKKQKDHKEHHDHKHHKNETSAEARPARSLKMRAELGEIFERDPESGNGTSGSTGDHKKHKDNKEHHDHKQHKSKTAAGTRLARSLKMRAELGEILERRRSWVWAI